MSHRIWTLVVAATLASSPFGFAQDPIPIGFSPYQPQSYPQPYPQGYPPQGYGGTPYGSPSPYATPQAPQQGIVPATLRHGHPVLAAPYAGSAPVASAPIQGSSCGCKSPLCALHGSTVPLFDGSHLKGYLSTGCFAGLFGHPTIARRPGPTAIDTLPTHPYARSPRDFFMFYENLEAERSRDLRPALIP